MCSYSCVCVRVSLGLDPPFLPSTTRTPTVQVCDSPELYVECGTGVVWLHFVWWEFVVCGVRHQWHTRCSVVHNIFGVHGVECDTQCACGRAVIGLCMYDVQSKACVQPWWYDPGSLLSLDPAGVMLRSLPRLDRNGFVFPAFVTCPCVQPSLLFS